MKILIVSQRFYPDNFRITDIASELVKRGHEVTVLTGLPMVNYKEYKTKKGDEFYNGFRIVRVKETERSKNIIKRLMNYYSFPYLANKKIKKLDKDFDVVLMNELSPIMNSKPALKYKKLNGAKVVMYEMDLWPESLLAGGIKKDGMIYNHFKKVSGKIYGECDKILVSTVEHADYIKNLPYCKDANIEYLPQYAEELFVRKEEFQNKTNKEYNFLFAGNVGKAQSCLTIIKAAELLKEHTNIKFTIIGNGTEWQNVKDETNKLGLQNVEVLDARPMSEMPELYAKSDALVVTLENSSYANMTIPGKVQGYLAAGKPILCGCNGATYNLVSTYNLGLASPSEDYETFADNVLKFVNLSNEELCSISNNCFKLYQKEFTLDGFIDRLIKNLALFSK